MLLKFKDFIAEGNPLARLHTLQKKGHAMIAISAERSGLSDKENAERHKQLGAELKKRGIGARETYGKWEGGGEKSWVAHSQSPSSEHKRQLLHHTRQLAQHFGQDSFFHHAGGDQEGKLVGTNKTGYPGYGKRDTVGKVRLGRSDPDFETHFKTRKPVAQRPKFSTD